MAIEIKTLVHSIYTDTRLSTINQETDKQLAALINDDWTIIPSLSSVHTTETVDYEPKHFRIVTLQRNTDFVSPAIQEQAQSIELINVDKVMRDTFYSKTSGNYRSMWRLKTVDGRSVNVFDHADPLRDQKRLIEEAGYLDIFNGMVAGDIAHWSQHPIAVGLVTDGSFWKVVHIRPRATGAGADPAPLTPADVFGDDDVDDMPFLLNGEPNEPSALKPFQTLNDSIVAPFSGAFFDVIHSGDYVILDTETTGLYDDAEICQIAIISSSGDILLNTLVKPQSSIPAKATSIHGITNDMVKAAPTWLNISEQVWSLLHGRTVITYNADYDFRLMAQSEQVCNPLATSDWHTIKRHCAMTEYADLYGDWNEYRGSNKWQSLTSAIAQQDLTVDAQAHSALGDCYMTLALVKHMANAVGIEAIW